MEWCLKAIQAGCTEALFNMGNNYMKGRGVEQDYDQAVMWYTKSAEAGIRKQCSSFHSYTATGKE